MESFFVLKIPFFLLNGVQDSPCLSLVLFYSFFPFTLNWFATLGGRPTAPRNSVLIQLKLKKILSTTLVIQESLNTKKAPREYTVRGDFSKLLNFGIIEASEIRKVPMKSALHCTLRED
ncbi:hypothetical protein AB8871_00710 [Chlamydia trachomatis]|uniref:hypothetical protein n=1 Tax=Chlamydia trachomatis TaxID=813 RepID=UPI00084C2DEB|nr:hypothetical protein [Chlamydia trachomatis]AOQ16207.1 hypothetical protein BBV13_00195 [Chlamydia trachomatis]AOQ17111.1 hypothetical protein BBV14_00195 [Chlamydia trachomatis]AOQ17933.1 hypothetical protein BBV15_00195 [Chlamydia trachomatis]AOQ18839.1 hypothetical protein BBV16_00195 [Chlamydia trachomatis]